MYLDVVTANLHVVSSHQVGAVGAITTHVRNVFGRWPDVIGLQEAIQLQSVEEVGRYRAVKTDRPKIHDNTNVVLIKKWMDLTSSTWHFGAPAFGNKLNHNPRHWHEVTFVKRGRKVAVIDAHLSVIAEPPIHERDLHSFSPVVQSHAEMVQNIVAAAEKYRAEGYLVVLTADSNDNTPWHYALRTSLAQAGYEVVRNGIDLVAYHHTQLASRGKKPLIVPKSLTKSDHEALAAACATV